MAGPEHQLAHYEIVDGVAVLAIDHPPVNALSHVVRIALMEGVARALSDPEAQALVLICQGRTFFAGADVKELSRPIEPPLLGDIMSSLEASPKPILSALHGTALGGGFELALAGHFRVAVRSAVVGLPEVALGLLPGAGGTQRVPRLVGVRAAVDLIGLGRHVQAPEALELGLIDAIVEEGALQAGAVAFARDVLDRNLPLRRVRDIDLHGDKGELDGIFAAFRHAHPELFVGLKAAEGAIAAIRAAATLPFDEGIQRERAIAQPLTASPESAAQRYLFFAERAAQKLPGGAAKVRAPSSVRVIGEWRHAAALPATSEGAEVLVVAHEDFSTCLASIGSATESVVLVLGHNARLSELRAAGEQGGCVIGFDEARGVVEIGIGTQFDGAAAMLAMGTARAIGLPAIVVADEIGRGVIARLLQRFAGTLAALRSTGVTFSDLAASMSAYGFLPGRYGVDDSGGMASESVINRIVGDMAHEAASIQSEGVVLRGSDIDFAMVRAGLWPLWRGGPAFVAEHEGAKTIAAWRSVAVKDA